MEFPKQLMTITELEQMGFSERQLRQIAGTVGYPVAIREGFGKTAPIKFDTEELHAYLKRTSKIMERR